MIDQNNLQKYSINGKKNNHEMTDRATIFRDFMGVCSDFINEEGMLQHDAGWKLGITVMLTPK